jgi:kumamolisin
MAEQRLVAIPDSHRDPLPGARRTADVPADDEIRLTIVVRRKAGGTEKALRAAGTGQPPGPGEPPASEAGRRRRLAEETGADEADIERVVRYVSDAGMRVESASAATRTVVARATAAQASAAFGVSLGRYETGGFAYRGREGAVHLPASLAGVVQAVLGLDNRPQARTHLKLGGALRDGELPGPAAEPASMLPALPARVAAAASPRPGPQPMWPMQVAQLYAFPTGVDGSGETIAIIELGGGFTGDELAAYFLRAGVPAPQVEAVGVGGDANDPGVDTRADTEVMLDIEVAGAVAPGARIAVYFGDTSDRGFYEALLSAVHDSQRSPSVVSISWGGPEDGWTGQAREAIDGVLADAAALGITVLAAAGDHGAGDAFGDGRAHVDFPASSPHIIGCGGTTLYLDGGQPREVAWNDGDGWATGGGISDAYDPPPWQDVMLPASLSGSGRPGRGVPDVAGNADNASGYVVLADGSWRTVGGTSAVAPLYAGLIALVNQALGHPVGSVLPVLYAMPSGAGALRDTTVGSNSVPASRFGPATGGYQAAPGWDACTGLGSIDGSALLRQLQPARPAPPAPVAGAAAG